MRARLLCLLFALLPAAVPAAELTGRVVGINDGDTLTLLTAEKRQVKVRLAEIDTPESRQPWGSRARQALSDLAFGKAARVEVRDTDRYGRTVGRVHVGEIDVNAELVRQGHAWVYRQYSRDPRLLELETEAKAAGRGLWSLPEAQRTPPWEWRHGERSTQRTAPVAPPVAATLPSHCGSKRTCGQMASCEEARFYLQQCGLSRLDGDGDGVPCEVLCR